MKDMDIDALRNAFAEEGYIADDETLMGVSLALRLKRPLLVEGAPGVGKTEIAKVLSRVLNQRLIRLQCYEGLDESRALYEWNYQAQLLSIQLQNKDHCADVNHSSLFSEHYLLERPLLRAIRSPEPVVLLIDEIDKTDPEFEAFLFEILSDFQVSVPELGTLKAVHIPAVVLTSNQERDLSDGLRRRCIYLYIDYPTPEKETEVLRRKVPSAKDTLVWDISRSMRYLRTELGLDKPPSTSEALDWATVLADAGVDRLTPDIVTQTLSLLLKSQDDLALFQEKIGADGLCALLNKWRNGADLEAKGQSLLARNVKKKIVPFWNR